MKKMNLMPLLPLILMSMTVFNGCYESYSTESYMEKQKLEWELENAAFQKWMNDRHRERAAYAENSGIGERSKEAILNQQIFAGMPTQDAKMAFNLYYWELSLSNSYGHEVWHLYRCYAMQYISWERKYYPRKRDTPDFTIYFDDGVLESWTQWGN